MRSRCVNWRTRSITADQGQVEDRILAAATRRSEAALPGHDLAKPAAGLGAESAAERRPDPSSRILPNSPGRQLRQARARSSEVDPTSDVNRPLKQRDLEHDSVNLRLSCSMGRWSTCPNAIPVDKALYDQMQNQPSPGSRAAKASVSKTAKGQSLRRWASISQTT